MPEHHSKDYKMSAIKDYKMSAIKYYQKVNSLRKTCEIFECAKTIQFLLITQRFIEINYK
jgi:hypothetical protein